MKYDVIVAGGDPADVKIAMAALAAGKSCKAGYSIVIE